LRLGILTSGGDSPGMNAALLGACREAESHGHVLLGIARGYQGLLGGELRPLSSPEILVRLSESGTLLGTSREPRMRSEEGIDAAAAAVRALGDALIVVGGKGSLTAAAQLAARGARVFGIPGTIDGDMHYPTATLGMDSAVNYGARIIDDLRVTALAMPGRYFLVETLGGDTGYLARATARVAGCELVITQDEPFDAAAFARRMRAALERDRFCIAVLAEGVGFATHIGAELEQELGARVRPTIIGHSMRAAPPSAFDRRLGLEMGAQAVQLALEGASSCMIGFDLGAGLQSHGFAKTAGKQD